MSAEFRNNRRAAMLDAPGTTSPGSPTRTAWGDEEPEAPGFKKWRVLIVIAVATAIGLVAHLMAKRTAAPRVKEGPQRLSVVPVTPTPPAVQPTPTPTPPPTAEEKFLPEEPDTAKPPEPASDPGDTTAVKGEGSGSLIHDPNGRRPVFAPGKSVSESRRRWSVCAGQAKSLVAQALESHPKTRKTSLDIVVSIWLDHTGRITKARVDDSRADRALVAAICDEILPGLQISMPPPQDMPMPIRMRITARRPN